MALSGADIRHGVGELGLAGRPLIVHSSLSSFGQIDGGADTVLNALLAEGCTVVVPTFMYESEVRPPANTDIERNGWQPGELEMLPTRIGKAYTPESNAIAADMGAIPRALLKRAGRQRGNHPLNPFAATGPLAVDIVQTQTPENVYGPLRKVAELDGLVLMMGVGLDTMTLIHTAEQDAGRNLFVRWAEGPDGEPIATRVGGCSNGFPKLGPILDPIARRTTVGSSLWQAFPAQQVLQLASAAIRRHPEITHCGNTACARCNAAVRGGPVV